MHPARVQPTAEQAQRYDDEYIARWVAIRRSTRPANRTRAEAAIAALYRQVQREAPRVIWLPCPLSAALSAMLYGAFRYRGVSTRQLLSNAPKALWQAVASQLDRAKSTVAGSLQGPALKTPEYQVADYVVGCALQFALRHVPYSGKDSWVDIVVHSNVRRVLNWIERSAEGYRMSRCYERAAAGEYSLDPVVRSRVHASVRAAIQYGLGAAAASDSRGLVSVERAYHADRALDINACFSGECAWADWASEVMGVPIDRHFLELAQSCGNCWLLDEVCFASERPSVINLGEAHRPHCETGPTLGYRSGWNIWHWEGVRIPPHVIEHPERLTLSRIDRVENVEVRRVMIERYGLARFTVEFGGRLIHEDVRGKLWRGEPRGREPIVVLEVRNSTPEPDGSFRTYYLRVPPEMRNASEAVAWTFGLTGSTYQPCEET